MQDAPITCDSGTFPQAMQDELLPHFRPALLADPQVKAAYFWGEQQSLKVGLRVTLPDGTQLQGSFQTEDVALSANGEDVAKQILGGILAG